MELTNYVKTEVELQNNIAFWRGDIVYLSMTAGDLGTDATKVVQPILVAQSCFARMVL
jgi:hypothetical protein